MDTIIETKPQWADSVSAWAGYQSKADALVDELLPQIVEYYPHRELFDNAASIFEYYIVIGLGGEDLETYESYKKRKHGDTTPEGKEILRLNRNLNLRVRRLRAKLGNAIYGPPKPIEAAPLLPIEAAPVEDSITQMTVRNGPDTPERGPAPNSPIIGPAELERFVPEPLDSEDEDEDEEEDEDNGPETELVLRMPPRVRRRVLRLLEETQFYTRDGRVYIHVGLDN